ATASYISSMTAKQRQHPLPVNADAAALMSVSNSQIQGLGARSRNGTSGARLERDDLVRYAVGRAGGEEQDRIGLVSGRGKSDEGTGRRAEAVPADNGHGIARAPAWFELSAGQKRLPAIPAACVWFRRRSCAEPGQEVVDAPAAGVVVQIMGG